MKWYKITSSDRYKEIAFIRLADSKHRFSWDGLYLFLFAMSKEENPELSISFTISSDPIFFFSITIWKRTFWFHFIGEI